MVDRGYAVLPEGQAAWVIPVGNVLNPMDLANPLLTEETSASVSFGRTCTQPPSAGVWAGLVLLVGTERLACETVVVACSPMNVRARDSPACDSPVSRTHDALDF